MWTQLQTTLTQQLKQKKIKFNAIYQKKLTILKYFHLSLLKLSDLSINIKSFTLKKITATVFIQYKVV